MAVEDMPPPPRGGRGPLPRVTNGRIRANTRAMSPHSCGESAANRGARGPVPRRAPCIGPDCRRPWVAFLLRREDGSWRNGLLLRLRGLDSGAVYPALKR